MATFFKNISIKIPRELVLSRLKFAKYKTKTDKRVSGLIADVLEEGQALLEPKASYEVFDITKSGIKVKLKGTNLTIESRPLAKHLRDASKVALFACTIGAELPNKVNEYVNKGEVARATILDAVGSEAAEALAEKVDGLIGDEARREGFTTLMRFSPGYGDWTIFDQEKILKILKANGLGIRLAKSFIMVPEKSVTACVGWVKKGPRPIRKVYERYIKPA